MSDWVLSASELKRYPHFDPPISASEAVALATDPTRVAAHTFYPFMLYEQRYNRFAQLSQTGKAKVRPIRYAARSDAYIMAYYRHVLAHRYEAELERTGLTECVLAYRRVREPDGRGKCNIHFARDAFMAIQGLGNCAVLAIDVSSFFESLDHAHLKATWCRLLGVSRLPPDHFRVFENVTKYSVVDKLQAYERLGHFGPKKKTKSGKDIPGYLTSHRKMPTQLCSGTEFRRLIAGGDGRPSLLKNNYKTFGIPQGSPISDLLANAYMLDFDQALTDYAKSLGGMYFRYSDDILLVLPGGKMIAENAAVRVQDIISQKAPRLIIKPEKTAAFVYEDTGDHQRFQLLSPGPQGKNGLEYLGFRYDGHHARIRDATLSNLYRKITRAARQEAERLARRYPNKTLEELQALVDFDRLVKRFGRVENFYAKESEYKNWTFWTYATRSKNTLGPLGRKIMNQMRRHRTVVRQKLDRALLRAVTGRERRAVGV